MSNPLTCATLISQSGITFGTSGARGLVTQFTDEVCAAFTQAFIEVMQRNFHFQHVALAIDLRPSSPSMAKACAAALQGLGLEVDYYGVIPTPALALQAMQDSIPAIMITGSHIPFDRNGMKFYRPDGEIEKADELAILDIDTLLLPISTTALPAPSSRAATTYLDRYRRCFPPQMLRGLTLGLYEHSSAGRDLYRQILEEFGAKVVSLGRTDQFVPIDTEAVSDEDRARGLEWSQLHGLDAILSTDGDADRPLIADEQGHWLRGDMVGLLTAQHLNIDALAVPVSCNTAIELCGVFQTVHRTRIGSPYVIAGMNQLLSNHERVAGFEANGGFLLGADLSLEGEILTALPTRDALLPALTLLSACHRNKQGLSTLAGEIPQRYTASDRITEIPTSRSQAELELWAASPALLLALLDLPQQSAHSVNTTDGLRITLDDQRIIHLRPSGNAPELRCYCEAEQFDDAVSLVSHTLMCVRDVLK